MTETPTHLVLWLSRSSCACKNHLTSQDVFQDADIAAIFALVEAHRITCTNLHPCLWFSTMPVSAAHSQDKGDQTNFTTHSRELVVTHKLRWMMTEVWLLSLSVDASGCGKIIQNATLVWGCLGRKRPTSATSPPKPTSWTSGHGKCLRLIVSRLTWFKHIQAIFSKSKWCKYQNAILLVHTDAHVLAFNANGVKWG